MFFKSSQGILKKQTRYRVLPCYILHFVSEASQKLLVGSLGSTQDLPVRIQTIEYLCIHTKIQKFPIFSNKMIFSRELFEKCIFIFSATAHRAMIYKDVVDFISASRLPHAVRFACHVSQRKLLLSLNDIDAVANRSPYK